MARRRRIRQNGDMMLAARFNERDPTGWWASEKLDGCRAFWDGAKLRTRTWLPIDAPDWLTAELPRGIALDGELWAGRGEFELVRVLVQYARASSENWERVRYCVFDAPTTDAVPLEKRLAKAQRLARGRGVEYVAQQRVESARAMWERFGSVVKGGGEGLVLRRPGSCYVFGRSADWMKVKPCNVD